MIETKARNRRVFLGASFGAAACATLLPMPSLATVGDAGNLVSMFHKELVPILSGTPGHLTAAALSNTVSDYFHIRLITRIVVGDHWQSMDSTAKQRLADAILDINVASYMKQLGNIRLSGHKIDRIREGEQHTTLVDATLSSAEGEMQLAYVTRRIKDRWWIIDVLLERKFSELNMRQAEYQGVIRQSGVDGLIATLETKAAQLASN